MSGDAGNMLLGNLEATFGNEISFSYYARMFSGGDKSIGHYFLQNTGSGTTFWWNDNIATDITPFMTGWAPVEFSIDTNWNDAEAEANGWIRATGSLSWADTLENVTFHNWFYNWTERSGSPGPTIIGGIDEIRVEGTPTGPDIVATALTIDGDDVNFSWEVRDQDLPEDTTVNLYWSEDATFGPGDTSALAQPVLVPAGTAVGTYSQSVANSGLQVVPAGTTHLLLVVDAANDISEADESNNVLEQLRRFDRSEFFRLYRQQFGRLTQQQVDGLETLVSFIEADVALNSIADVRFGAYLLATAKHETANTFQPVEEGLGRLSPEYFNRRYGPNTRVGMQLGNTEPGDGYRFRGRGYVQITGRSNYASLGTALGLDLVGDPDLALQPAVAYRIMSHGMLNGVFSRNGERLVDFITDTDTDYFNARRTVNLLDRAGRIAVFAERFERILRGSQIPIGAPQP